MNKFLLVSALLATALVANAEISLPHIVSDNMIVQRDRNVCLWGNAAPGETVVVRAVRDNKKGKSYKKAETIVVAGDDGRWLSELPPMSAGSTYTVTINDVTLHNVTPGDVFLCSGQSNMELPVRRVTDMFADEIAEYSNPWIREFAVPNDFEFHAPLDDVKPTAWREVTPDQAMSMSALGYFFAKALYEQTGVPVGIVRSCWGGTPVEAWISDEWIADYPRAVNEKKLYEDDAYRAEIKKLEGQNYRHWETVLNNADPGLNGSVKWYDPALDDSQWQRVDLLSSDWATDGVNPVNGSHWFRKVVDIPASMAGKPGMLRLGCIVDADSAWVNGCFVGNITYQYPPRKYPIPAGVLKEGSNVVTVRVISQHDLPHFVPEKPYKIVADDQVVSLEGDWRYHLGTPMVPGPDMEFWCYKPVVLYNAMIAPLANYPFAGAVWYQGESNTARHNEYSSLLKSMMGCWRETFADPDLPFYIVELANFMAPNQTFERSQWAKLREAQAQAVAETPGATLIHNSDLGEWNDIHPLDKKTLGSRIAASVMQNLPKGK